MSEPLQPPGRGKTPYGRLRLPLGAKGHICPWWAVWTLDNPLRRMVHDPEAVLGKWVGEGMRVADVGCGAGHFTLGMARLVGPRGHVVAADVQPQMLQKTLFRARRAGLSDRISTIRVEPEGEALPGTFSFILVFWMLHEVPDQERFLGGLAGCLAPEGLLLLAEPVFHVRKRDFARSVEAARRAGWKIVKRPDIRLSRAVLLGLGAQG